MTSLDHLEAARAHLAGASRALQLARAGLSDLELDAVDRIRAEVNEAERRLTNVVVFARKAGR